MYSVDVGICSFACFGAHCVGCTSVNMCVEARSCQWMSSSVALHFIYGGRLSFEHRDPHSAGLVTQLTARITVSSSQALELQAAATPAQHGFKESKFWSSSVHSKALPTEPSPSPQVFLKDIAMKGINVYDILYVNTIREASAFIVKVY